MWCCVGRWNWMCECESLCLCMHKSICIKLYCRILLVVLVIRISDEKVESVCQEAKCTNMCVWADCVHMRLHLCIWLSPMNGAGHRWMWRRGGRRVEVGVWGGDPHHPPLLLPLHRRSPHLLVTLLIKKTMISNGIPNMKYLMLFAKM